MPFYLLRHDMSPFQWMDPPSSFLRYHFQYLVDVQSSAQLLSLPFPVSCGRSRTIVRLALSITYLTVAPKSNRRMERIQYY